MAAGQTRGRGQSPFSGRRKVFTAILITMLCAPVLAVGSCFGLVATKDSASSAANILPFLLIASLVIFAGAFVGLLGMIIVSLFQGDR